MKVQVNLTMRVVGNQTPNQACGVSSKFKIPKPKAVKGNRDAKEIENFIFHMERYFKASGTNSEETKVTLVGNRSCLIQTGLMCLSGSTSAWGLQFLIIRDVSSGIRLGDPIARIWCRHILLLGPLLTFVVKQSLCSSKSRGKVLNFLLV